MEQILKGRLVENPYKPICRDCAMYFSITLYTSHQHPAMLKKTLHLTKLQIELSWFVAFECQHHVFLSSSVGSVLCLIAMVTWHRWCWRGTGRPKVIKKRCHGKIGESVKVCFFGAILGAEGAPNLLKLIFFWQWKQERVGRQTNQGCVVVFFGVFDALILKRSKWLGWLVMIQGYWLQQLKTKTVCFGYTED